MSATTVGIDLGTTISLLASIGDGGRPDLVRTRDGGPRLRSVVHIGADGEPTVGEQAQRLSALDPDATFAFFKRAMGTDWRVEAGGRGWAPEDLSACVLRALLEDAGESLGASPRRAVVTIPAYFGDDARRATQRAAALAGLDDVTLLHEPTAACLALGDARGTVLVYDLGGGTFDVSVVRFGGAGADVLATAGDHRLGGKDWDDVLVDMVADRLSDELGDDPRDDPQLLAVLQERAREAKHALSRLERTAVTLHAAGRVHRVEIAREDFWRRSASLIERTATLVADVVADVGGAGAIDEALLVGGSVRMPPCVDALRAATGKAPRMVGDPDEAVAVGAAFAARRADAPAAAGSLRRIRDVTAHALGFVVLNPEGSRYVNQVMIARNAPIPAAATKRHKLALGGSGSGSLDVYMLQGEAERPLDTSPLGRWTFAGVRGPKRAAQVDVEVSYRYDDDGVVHVAAAVGGRELDAPTIDREDRDLRWTEEDPTEHQVPDLVVALVIDVSSSMSGRSLREAKEACHGFVAELESAGVAQRVALVSFGSRASTHASVGASSRSLRKAVDGLSADGSTNMSAGLRLAKDALAHQDGRRVAVVLTDGAPNSQADALSERDRLVDAQIEIIARGVTGANEAFLKQLASGDGVLLDLADLGAGFRGIAQQLTRGAAGLRRRPA